MTERVSGDPITAAATMLDVVTAVLSRPGDLAYAGKQLSRKIRELTGARATIVAAAREHAGTAAEYTILGINPPRHAGIAETDEGKRLVEIALGLGRATLWKSGAGTGEAESILSRMGFSSALAMPLMVDGETGGAIVSLGLNNEDAVRPIMELQDVLSKVVSIVLKNCLHIENQKQLREEFEAEVTERKKTAESLRRSEAYYRDLVENIEDLVCTHDLQGNITFVNSSSARLLGYEPADMVGTNLIDYLAPKSLARLDNYLSTLRTEEYATGLMGVRTKSGDTRLWEYSSRMRKERAAEPFVLGIARDVTERKRAAEALKESEAKYRFLAEHASDVLWTTDLNMHTTYVSPSVEWVLGFTPEERMGQRVEDKLTAESLEMVRQKLLEALRMEREQGAQPYRFTLLELDFLHKNGSIVCLETVIRFIRDEKGSPIGIHGLSRDITERKKAEKALQESEQRYKAVVDNIEIGISLMNPEMEIVEVNKAFNSYFPHVQPGSGQICYEQINDPPRSGPCSYCPCVRTLRDGEVHEVITETPAGSEIRHYRLVSSPMKDSDGRVTNVVKLTEDITERRRAEEALDRANKDWERTFNAISDGIMVLDHQHKVVRANRAMSDVLGRTEQELIGRFCYEVVHGEHEPPAFCPHSQLLADGEEHSVEIVEPRLGAILDVRVSPIHGPGGRVLGSVHLVHDITERTRVERDLERQVSLMESLLETIPAPVFFKSTDHIYTGSNEAFAQLIGLPVEDIVGKTVFDVAPKELAEVYRTHDEILFKEAGPQVYESSVVRGDGTKRNVIFHKAPFSGADGTVAGLVGVIWDITERKKAEKDLRESEERFRAIFECAEECVYIKDRSLAFTHVNPAWCRLFGLAASEIVGYRSEDLFGTERGRQVTEMETRVLEGESIETVQTRVIGKQSMRFHETLVPLKNREGETIGICCISRDITHRRRFESGTEVAVHHYTSEAMNSTLKRVLIAARTDSIVLLQGESGSGKDFVARWLHDHSKRAGGSFFAINCAALPKELAESELFGHERGAFTGAGGTKKGLLELAEGGTILLNEIGELDLVLQSKLLTFLDSRSFVRVGGEKPVQVNTRLLAATHRDLLAEVAEKRFLEALFYRLNVVPIFVPPLRDRMQDLPLLVEGILSKLAVEMQLTELPRITSRHIEVLSRYHWPGNVRELRNVLERSLILWSGGEFDLAVPVTIKGDSEWCYTVRYVPGRKLRDVTDEVELSLSAEVLRRCGGNKLLAAQLLHISRDTLYRYIRKLKRKSKS